MLHWRTERRFTMRFPIGGSDREDRMKLRYFPETDTLYISLSEQTSVDSDEIAEDVVVDYGKDGRVVGIEIEHASKMMDLTKLETESVPLKAT